MVTVDFRPYELRGIIEALHECGKKRKCYGKIGFGKGGLKKIKCEVVIGFGIRNTKELIPKAYKDCYGKKKEKRKS